MTAIEDVPAPYTYVMLTVPYRPASRGSKRAARSRQLILMNFVKCNAACKQALAYA